VQHHRASESLRGGGRSKRDGQSEALRVPRGGPRLVTSCHQVNCLARTRILRDYGPRYAPRAGTESSLVPFRVVDATLSGGRIMTVRRKRSPRGWRDCIQRRVNWDSPASTDSLTLRDTSFFFSILLKGGETSVSRRWGQPAGVVEGLQRKRRQLSQELPFLSEGLVLPAERLELLLRAHRS
jgi:hypothetical protein